MSLIKCDECGSKISDQANCCPNCGCPVKSITYCPNCGAKVTSGNFCTNCGKNFTNENIKNNRCSLALAGGITGISSFIVDPIGIASITAIVLSSIGLYKTNKLGLKGKGWAITGLACGIVELVFKIIMLAYYLD